MNGESANMRNPAASHAGNRITPAAAISLRFKITNLVSDAGNRAQPFKRRQPAHAYILHFDDRPFASEAHRT
jgi:hypothetical protein